MKDQVKHPGIVDQVFPDKVVVKIINVSACASCHAKGACTMSDMKEKEIEVRLANHHFLAGDHVQVIMQEHLAWTAVFFAYIMPFILMIVSLFSSVYFFNNEILAFGIMTLTLTLYFLGLYFFRNKLDKRFEFTLERDIPFE